MIINGNLMKLGKKKAVKDDRTFKLSRYIAKLPPPPPVEVSWITKLIQAEALPMFMNDTLGICGPAGAGHMLQQWNFYAGHPWQPSDADVMKCYEDVGGYVPGDPSTDRGVFLLDLFKYWRKVGIGGHKIGAFVAVDWTNLQELKMALALLGNVGQGFALPVTAQGQSNWVVGDGGTHAPAGEPGSWGGHFAPLAASSLLTHTAMTWGTIIKMSHNFLGDYGDEAYAAVSQDWIETAGVAPSGFDIDQLRADLSAL